MVVASPSRTGVEVVEHLRAGRFSQVHAMFATHLQALVPAETLRTAWQSIHDQHGPFVAAGDPTATAGPVGTSVVVPVLLAQGTLFVELVVDASGRLVGLQLTPPHQPWQPPDYADRAAFDEHEITLGSGPLAVPATITVPRSATRCPAVVLLPGGGPFDRDATSGSNKPLKDIAWGLAGRGVVVVRFDKVTHVHAAMVAQHETFTMTDEYVPHAVAAVQVLCEHPSVDAGRVYVLGHSMGGKVAALVAAAEPAVAGLILMAADAEPMQWAAVRVARYLSTFAPDGGAAAAQAVETLTCQAQLVDSDDLSSETDAGRLPLGLSAAYWLDLRGYDPVVTAATVGKPMLILQGGRDYQVTVDDDLARWRAGLDGRPEVIIRVYDADNHLFFPGTGPSTPAEYGPPQHVDPHVIDDITAWLTTGHRLAAP
ncbi:alpha/beta fold hydrolase [Nocardia sp. NPDC059180]|uniref:alpha/beta hydrolase n=1 Tax=Nocardia sp. NPDC059180 TaxID=3346761 RepID=UPI0036A11D65